MAGQSYPFAVGRVKVLENRLLDRSRWARLRESDLSECFRILQESGYGSDADRSGDVDALISAELTAARNLIKEISPAPELTALFAAEADAHNLKVLFKARLLSVSADDLLLQGGLFGTDTLKTAVTEKDYSALPDTIATALEKLEDLLSDDPSPRILSAMIDGAVMRHVLTILDAHKDKTLTEYFRLKIDFLNVESLIRGIALDWGQAELAPLLLEGGYIPVADYMPAITIEHEKLSHSIHSSKSTEYVEKALEEFVATGDVAKAVSRMDDALLTLVHEKRFDSFGVGPLLSYLLDKQAEGTTLRMLFAAKRAGLSFTLPERYA